MIKFRLKVLLAEHDMTQKELAEKTGIPPMTISKMCRNEIVQIPVKALDQICEVLDCDVIDIMKRY